MTSILKVDNIKDSADNQAISISGGAVTMSNSLTTPGITSTAGITTSDNLLFNAAGKGVYLGTTSANSLNLLDD